MPTKPELPSLFEAYATDVALEEQGVPVELRNGATMIVRSENSLAARRWLTKKVKEQRSLIAANRGLLPPEKNDQNDIDELAEVLIVGWKNVTDRAGNEIPHSVEMARTLMKELPALRRDLLLAARTDETFRREVIEDMAGNSAAPSESSSSSAAS